MHVRHVLWALIVSKLTLLAHKGFCLEVILKKWDTPELTILEMEQDTQSGGFQIAESESGSPGPFSS